MNLQRGDVVLCRVPMPSTGLTQFKVRPAVVISANRLNQILDETLQAIAYCEMRSTKHSSLSIEKL
ncbi:type II toxin-antitoxin system PemK/MazF family toxin [uncultured Nostoc sp.]|uniref:type II toxin-antitoxin system PemK/MazF family toxin n=1 Tax=uncultured Nostoc sp. TaxID=340711 RepID=UPI0035C9F7F8